MKAADENHAACGLVIIELGDVCVYVRACVCTCVRGRVCVCRACARACTRVSLCVSVFARACVYMRARLCVLDMVADWIWPHV